MNLILTGLYLFGCGIGIGFAICIAVEMTLLVISKILEKRRKNNVVN